MQTSFKRKSSEPILEPNSELSNLYGHHLSIRSNLAPVLPNQPPLVTLKWLVVLLSTLLTIGPEILLYTLYVIYIR